MTESKRERETETDRERKRATEREGERGKIEREGRKEGEIERKGVIERARGKREGVYPCLVCLLVLVCLSMLV